MNTGRIYQRWILAAAFLCAGCSATPPLLINEWRNPAYGAPAFETWVVGASSEQTSIRRSFEDAFVAQLRDSGVKASQSYLKLSGNGKVDEAGLKEAARAAGADALLSARFISIEQKTEVGPSYYPVPSFGIFGRNFGGVWHGLSGPPTVSRTTEYTSETTLYDLGKNEIVWSGTVKTAEPENVNSAIQAYVETVIAALREKKLLGARK